MRIPANVELKKVPLEEMRFKDKQVTECGDRIRFADNAVPSGTPPDGIAGFWRLSAELLFVLSVRTLRSL